MRMLRFVVILVVVLTARAQQLTSGNRLSSRSGDTAPSLTGPNITSDQPVVAGKYYYGGSTVPYYAGMQTPTGLNGSLYLISMVVPHFSGYWGYGDSQVWAYDYSVLANGSVSYDSHCYCIQFFPCSCDRVDNTQYFTSLPSNRYQSVFQNTTNQIVIYINGTLVGQEKVIINTGTKFSSPKSILLLTLVSVLVLVC
jgi:hypothetical protein